MYCSITFNLSLNLYFYIEAKEECSIFPNSAPVSPRTWYHICVGIDTNSGLLRIVDNGVKTFEGEKDFFKNTASIKPKSVAGKLLGKGSGPCCCQAQVPVPVHVPVQVQGQVQVRSCSGPDLDLDFG